MSLKPLLTALVCCMIIISCSKDKSGAIPENKCDYIKGMVSFNYLGEPADWTNITYDNEGRVATVSGGGSDLCIYKYTKTTIEARSTDINGEKNTTIYNLDKQGRIVKASDNSEFRYNNEGYLVVYKSPVTNNGEQVGLANNTFTYENGNLVKIHVQNGTVDGSKITFTYYDKPVQELMGYNSPLMMVIGLRNERMLIQAGFFGKTSRNLMKTYRYDDEYPRDDVKYEYDSKGRISMMTNYKVVYNCD
ncbi:DUF4595 domain-containing protein [Pedobacter sp. B4-66]|uniref:DUF4595 domain-containing protein n=1 Tax=Pedobacter sp. B4-66 TaxID=2817280 RepID=UPI001BD95053|nr:DUF4595 domain-containing protein [Pedobacter sp. B4-66]